MIEEMRNMNLTAQQNNIATTQEDRIRNISLHYHQGRYIRIPPDFVFPTKCSLKDIFLRFHVHDTVREIPPFKLIDSASVVHIKRGKVYLSELRYLMAVMELECVRLGIDTDDLNDQQEASEAFEKVKECIYRYETRSTRKEQFKWQTWVKKLRVAGVRYVRG